MTHDEFISLVRQPEQVTTEHVVDLKEMVELYPYFSPARLFHAKALQRSNSILFGANLKFSSLYSSNRRWLYYYIYPDKKVSAEPYKRDKPTKSSGDYFDMITVVESEGGDTKQTLKTLAERLKSARSLVSIPAVKSKQASVVEVAEVQPVDEAVVAEGGEPEDKSIVDNDFAVNKPELSEDNAKKLIREHKYMEAIEILRVLNLNNPKKSVYFADQIRFLEKVLANSKK
jgi:hypothetical protein